MPPDVHSDRILILDFGAQYTQLIARRLREHQVYCEIHPHHWDLARIRAWKPRGIILSGGPSSVLSPGAPSVDPEIYRLGVPVLGICYGLQLLCHQLGGLVEKADDREYGRALLKLERDHPLFAALPGGVERTVWMSHGDRVLRLPPGFEVIATSENSPFAAVAHASEPIVGVQFHPEVVHTEAGGLILRNFARGMCGCAGVWTPAAFVEDAIARVRERVGDKRVICGLSGGVDSSVAAALVHRAIGDRLTCIFVDHGLLREGERAEVERTFRETLQVPLVTVDAADRFLGALTGVIDPEKKRSIIGHQFIEVFDETAAAARRRGLPGAGHGLPRRDRERLGARPVGHHQDASQRRRPARAHAARPRRAACASCSRTRCAPPDASSACPKRSSGRHPFPGPGLAIRILGEVTRERLAILRRADAILIEEIRKAGLYDEIWQAFAVFLPIQSVGVMGDERTYDHVIGLRCVTSVDAMTADWARLPHDLLASVSSRITNEVKGVNRVVYDVSSKPPATIEWE